MLIFSSSSILETLTNRSEFLHNFIKLSDKKASIRILVDSDDNHFLDKFKYMYNEPGNLDLISISFTEKLGKFKEMVMISDSKHVIQIKYNSDESNLIASFSNIENQVLVQEILFEKYWNEINGLTGANR